MRIIKLLVFLALIGCLAPAAAWGDRIRIQPMPPHIAPEWTPVPEIPNLYHAPNIPTDVFRYDRRYFFYYEGVWYMSKRPKGPWRRLDRVPSILSNINPSYFKMGQGAGPPAAGPSPGMGAPKGGPPPSGASPRYGPPSGGPPPGAPPSGGGPPSGGPSYGGPPPGGPPPGGPPSDGGAPPPAGKSGKGLGLPPGSTFTPGTRPPKPKGAPPAPAGPPAAPSGPPPAPSAPPSVAPAPPGPATLPGQPAPPTDEDKPGM
jgi:hypothetical protein